MLVQCRGGGRPTAQIMSHDLKRIRLVVCLAGHTRKNSNSLQYLHYHMRSGTGNFVYGI